jgi:hypothetical protein
MTLADAISSERTSSVGEVNLSAPTLEVTGACFALSILAKFVGAWGVCAQRIRHISIFIAVNLLLVICKLVIHGSACKLAMGKFYVPLYVPS